ncbi:MAG: hypothetical protein E6R12_06120 [Sphingomonadales bacterium]|nr:MAG: hypothetical protein E6R12_06120 [Sphingomonadales bacterium]
MTALDYFRFVGALLLVLGLMVGMAYALRRWGGKLTGLAGGQPGVAPRLTVLETRFLDPRHKLVLIRRDAAEHLLLIGPGVATAVETVAAKTELPHDTSPTLTH